MNDLILDNPGPSQSLFDELVGPGKRYADKDVFAKAKQDSDSYIKILEAKIDNAVADNKTLREANNSQANMQELIETFRSMQTKSEPTTQPQSQQDNKPSTLPNDLDAKILEGVRKVETQKTEQANLDKVKSKIKEKWGDNVPASVREQIDRMGDTGTTLAKRFPDEFLRTIGAETVQRQPNFSAPPRGVLNSDNLRSQEPGERTWAWYQKLRKENPSEYYSKKMTVQMHNDAQRLGERFADGDFDTDDRELLRTKYSSSF